jgi:sulfocyanin
MSHSRSFRRPVLLLTGGLVGASFTGCSKPADRPQSIESGSPSAQVPADSMPAADSSKPKPVPADTATATSAAAASPKVSAQTTPRPKPSIDPGKKNPKSVTIPRAATNPSSDSAAPAAAAASDQGQPLKYDAASNTVTFELVAGPFNFNGFTSGGATLTVPAKANMMINFVNKDGTPHSAEVISGDGPIPNAAVDPAIPLAYTVKVLEGLPQEGKDVMKFTVPESGKYRIFCGVPGHGLSGMWIWMVVDPAAKTPSFGPTK